MGQEETATNSPSVVIETHFLSVYRCPSTHALKCPIPFDQMLSLLTPLQMQVMSSDYFIGAFKICSNLFGKKKHPTAFNWTCKRSGFYGNKRTQEKIL